MITLFNRRELCITFSFEQQADIRARLSSAGIDYRIKTTNYGSGAFISRGSGTFVSRGLGINTQAAYEYKFYVHKVDLAQAKHIIGKTSN